MRMHKMILSLMALMVLTLACVMPAFASDGYNINKNGSSLNAPIDQADLVENPAVVAYRSYEVLPLACTECPEELATSNKMKIAGTFLVATYNPSHDKFDYGEFTFTPQLE